MKDKVYGAVDTARPYVDRIARDDELHEHVKNAYASARSIYDELLGGRGPQAVAGRVAKDKDIQAELKKAVEELRLAGGRVAGEGVAHEAQRVPPPHGHHARRPLQPGDGPADEEVAEGQGPRPRAALRVPDERELVSAGPLRKLNPTEPRPRSIAGGG